MTIILYLCAVVVVVVASETMCRMRVRSALARQAFDFKTRESSARYEAARLAAAKHADDVARARLRAEEIDEVVKRVYADVGLNPAAYSDGMNLAATGKIFDVLHHAASKLGVDAELATVGDVKKWLAE